jgi:hypothetical protein
MAAGGGGDPIRPSQAAVTVLAVLISHSASRGISVQPKQARVPATTLLVPGVAPPLGVRGS